MVTCLGLLGPGSALAADRGAEVVVHGRSGAAGGYDVTGEAGRFSTRLGLGAGFLDRGDGGGVLLGVDLVGGAEAELGFVDGLRFEVSLHIWTPKGAVRLFGGRRLGSDAGFGGATYGLPIPVGVSSALGLGVIPEVGVWVGENPRSGADVLGTLGVLFDLYWFPE